MSVILLLLGVLAIGAGLTAIGFGIPVYASELGYTLILSGVTALSSGLILFGLAAAVHQLTRIAQGLRVRAQPRSVRAAEAPSQPFSSDSEIPARPGRAAEARPGTPPLDVSSSAIERLRSTIPRPDRVVPEAEGVPLSPSGDSNHHEAQLAPEPKGSASPPRSRTGEVETTREPRLDFLFRSRATQTGQQRESFESVWPKQPARQQDGQGQVEKAPNQPVAPTEATPPSVPEHRAVPEPAAPPVTGEAAPAIIKSGVVDGMAYTLYADGSIEAQLPQGTVRFASITELRAHIDSNS
jgi:hypothetical protein